MQKRRQKTGTDATSSEPTLARVLDQSEEVEEKVEAAASDLADVTQVLKQEVHKGTPLDKAVGALARSANAESKVQEAALGLAAVNDALSAEIDDRITIQDELLQSQQALTVSRDHAERARHESLHDNLTGLPTAALFKDHLKRALAQSRRHQWQFAVMFIDLDGFKSVNDAHGHDVGDALLRSVAKRMLGFVREGDTVSRRSGDEFLYLMLEAGSLDNARSMAQNIIAVLAAPLVVGGVSHSLQASIGLAMFPEDGTTPAALLKRADLAMYEAKRQRLAGR